MTPVPTWHGHCFGLRVTAGFPLPGCEGSPEVPETLPRVAIELGDAVAVRRALDPAGSRVIGRLRDAGGRWREHVREHPRAGYLITSPGHGLFHVNRGGDRVLVARRRVPTWRWQRGLIGEALPFVSALRGFETLHASGLVIAGDGAVAISGPSGSGKSSLAANLVLAGATLLADDVLALRCQGGAVVAHPGAGLMSLRPVTLSQLGVDAVGRLGELVGQDAQRARVAVPRHPGPVRLGALYLLEIDAGARSPWLLPVPAPDPRLLLGSTFNFVLRTPARLMRQFEVCAAMASAVRVVRVSMPPCGDHAEVAAMVLADARRRADPRRGG